ncbi:MAG TPA: metallophosphoesterase family protein [Anaerolineales bacterium]|nr:metallophosphoesterase family protein [Anaerolineales bacterium]
MRILVLSDIHANLEALETVLADAGSVDSVWCLGDLVGYGPNPNEVIDRVRDLPGLLSLIGNHDQAALGIIPLSRFNQDAGAAAAWTMEQLRSDNAAYLRSLPSRITFEDFTLAHGSPRQPVWEYILDLQSATGNFDSFTTNYCLIGHSHLPLVFHRAQSNGTATSVGVSWDAPLALEPRMILNPGSVGQPRDMDPRAAYAILDTQALTWSPRRVAYDAEKTREKMLNAGLPERQASRLLAGW